MFFILINGLKAKWYDTFDAMQKDVMYLRTQFPYKIIEMCSSISEIPMAPI